MITVLSSIYFIYGFILFYTYSKGYSLLRYLLKRKNINAVLTIELVFIILLIYVIISVKDNGSGINKEIKDKILEPYYTTKVNGTGLGLAISKKIIEDHNGTIHLNSEVDEGTCVKIKFPLSK